MFKRILVAVDLGHPEDAKVLIAEAGRLADFDNAELSLVAVIPDYGTSYVEIGRAHV